MSQTFSRASVQHGRGKVATKEAYPNPKGNKEAPDKKRKTERKPVRTQIRPVQKKTTKWIKAENLLTNIRDLKSKLTPRGQFCSKLKQSHQTSAKGTTLRRDQLKKNRTWRLTSKINIRTLPPLAEVSGSGYLHYWLLSSFFPACLSTR